MHRRLSFCIFLLIIGLISDFCDGFREDWTEEVSSNDGKCLLDDGGLKEVDEAWYDDEKCQKYKCSKDDVGQFYLNVEGCMRVIPSYCKPYYEDRVGRFPDCCPMIACP